MFSARNEYAQAFREGRILLLAGFKENLPRKDIEWAIKQLETCRRSKVYWPAMKDHPTNHQRGFCHISFDSKEAARHARNALNNLFIGSRFVQAGPPNAPIVSRDNLFSCYPFVCYRKF
jgi:hypothetical protein